MKEPIHCSHTQNFPDDVTMILLNNGAASLILCPSCLDTLGKQIERAIWKRIEQTIMKPEPFSSRQEARIHELITDRLMEACSVAAEATILDGRISKIFAKRMKTVKFVQDF